MTTPEHGEHSQGVGTAPVVGETPGIWDTTQARRFRAGADGRLLPARAVRQHARCRLALHAVPPAASHRRSRFLAPWRHGRLPGLLQRERLVASAEPARSDTHRRDGGTSPRLRDDRGRVQLRFPRRVLRLSRTVLRTDPSGTQRGSVALGPQPADERLARLLRCRGGRGAPGRDGGTWPLVVAARLLLARRLSDPRRATLVGTPPARRGDPCGPTGDELTTASPRPEAFLGTRAAHVLLRERRRDGGRVVDGELPRGSLAAAGGRRFRSRGVLLLGRIGRLAPDCPRSVGTSTPPVSCWQASSSSSAGSAAVWAAPRCWLRHRQPGTARVRDRTSAAGAHEPDATTCRHDPSDWSDRQADRRRQPGRLLGCSACAGFVLQHEGFSATGPVLTGFALVLAALLAVMHRAPTFEVPAGIGGGS